MAITRATGKAYRLGLSWIVTLAGYQPTPAEEMFDIDIPQDPKPAKKTAPKKEFVPNPEPVETIQTDLYLDTPENKRAVMNHFATMELPLDKEHMINVHQMMLGKQVDAAEKLLVDYCRELKERQS
jgi:ABC-type proline/glycine betaine transport system substrate-binding protein